MHGCRVEHIGDPAMGAGWWLLEPCDGEYLPLL